MTVSTPDDESPASAASVDGTTMDAPARAPESEHRANTHPSVVAWFPGVVLALVAVGLVIAGLLLVRDRPAPSDVAATPDAGDIELGAARTGGIDFGSQPADPNADPAIIATDTAAAMGAVTSVEFEVDRAGHPVFIDQFGSISLDHLVGQFEEPDNAQAIIEVTIDETNRTRLGAIAVGDEIWLSNPVTGAFETLPDGYDLDPSRFFDPQGGWQPLLANLTNIELVGVDDRDDVAAYHLSGTADAADVTTITAGLIRDQDVPVDLWIDPGTSLVMFADFTTTTTLTNATTHTTGTTHTISAEGGEDTSTSTWEVGLRDYGADFDIGQPPEGPRP